MHIHGQSGQMMQYSLDCLALKIAAVRTEFESILEELGHKLIWRVDYVYLFR